VTYTLDWQIVIFRARAHAAATNGTSLIVFVQNIGTDTTSIVTNNRD
jgi:hypothetical protein